jgi:hypothetical protein
MGCWVVFVEHITCVVTVANLGLDTDLDLLDALWG